MAANFTTNDSNWYYPSPTVYQTLDWELARFVSLGELLENNVKQTLTLSTLYSRAQKTWVICWRGYLSSRTGLYTRAQDAALATAWETFLPGRLLTPIPSLWANSSAWDLAGIYSTAHLGVLPCASASDLSHQPERREEPGSQPRIALPKGSQWPRALPR